MILLVSSGFMSRTVSSAPRQPQCQKEAVRIFRVIAERAAIGEPKTFIEPLSRLKRLHGTRLQTQAKIPARFRYLKDVGQDGASRTPTPKRDRSAHRLDFTMLAIELPERPAAMQYRTIPGSPEGNLGLAQMFNVKRVNALSGRKVVHVLQVFFQQCMNLGTREIIDLDTKPTTHRMAARICCHGLALLSHLDAPLAFWRIRLISCVSCVSWLAPIESRCGSSWQPGRLQGWR
jgi:hypothetical protein